MILKNLNLRQQSYPFDWVTHTDQLYNTNILYNIELIKELKTSVSVDTIVTKYIGNAFDTENKLNTTNNIWFPHDNEEHITAIREKYTRRFLRLKTDLDKKNMFILLTRHFFIEEEVFQTIMEELLHNESIIIFISGRNHPYFQYMNCDNVIFKYIEYDISKFYDYDYSTFRPNVQRYLSSLLV
jgi:hypothetical protein